MAGAATLLSLAPAVAARDVVVDEGGDDVDLSAGRNGMPASNPLVKDILAAHPGQFVVVCVAGCDSKQRVVQVLAKPVVARAGKVVPTAGEMGSAAYGPPTPGHLRSSESDDVVCVAGCSGRPGQVLQRFPDLPPPPKRQAQNAPKTAKPKPPAKAEGDGFLDDLIP